MIKHILFDLDNTIYSARWGLEEFFFNKVKEFVTSRLGMPADEAMKLWREGYNRHGTTAGWLVSEINFSPIDDYYNYVHPENEADSLVADPELRRFLESLPCPCSILTNSPAFHADRIIKKMELEGVFRHVFDITGFGFVGKPAASAYLRALDVLGHEPREVLFVDDVPRYVEGYLAIGGKGVLLDERDAHKDYPHARIKKLTEIKGFF